MAERSLLDNIERAKDETGRRVRTAQVNINLLYDGVKNDAIDKDTILRLLKETDKELRAVDPHGRPIGE